MSDHGKDAGPARRYRFGIFEADAATGELRRQGMRIKLNAQPFQVLLLLLARPGQLLTREEISRELWPDGTFVDYEHGVNSAVNRIREALGDTAANPRFLENLARRGYLFIAQVERVDLQKNVSREDRTADVGESPSNSESAAQADEQLSNPASSSRSRLQILATPEELPKVPYRIAQTLFILFQLMYLGFYVG